MGETRFGCEYRSNGCFLKGTNLFQIGQSKGRLSSVVFFCESFDGCSFSNDEVIEALAAQKSLNFNGTCTMTELGAKVCVEYRNITMYRKKFRVPELNFD